MIEFSDFIFCNRDEAIACKKHLYRELGLSLISKRNTSNEEISDEEKDLKELRKIALAVARYKKNNTKRPRVMVITNSANPVTVAVGQFEQEEECTFTVPV